MQRKIAFDQKTIAHAQAHAKKPKNQSYPYQKNHRPQGQEEPNQFPQASQNRSRNSVGIAGPTPQRSLPATMIVWVLQGLLHRPVLFLHFVTNRLQCDRPTLHRQPIGRRPGLGHGHPQHQIRKEPYPRKEPQQKNHHPDQSQIQPKIGRQTCRNPSQHSPTPIPKKTLWGRYFALVTRSFPGFGLLSGNGFSLRKSIHRAFRPLRRTPQNLNDRFHVFERYNA